MIEFLKNLKVNKKPAFEADSLGVPNIVWNSRLSTYSNYSKPSNLVKFLDDFQESEHA